MRNRHRRLSIYVGALMLLIANSGIALQIAMMLVDRSGMPGGEDGKPITGAVAHPRPAAMALGAGPLAWPAPMALIDISHFAIPSIPTIISHAKTILSRNAAVSRHGNKQENVTTPSNQQ